jgi:hypothetical protein
MTATQFENNPYVQAEFDEYKREHPDLVQIGPCEWESEAAGLGWDMLLDPHELEPGYTGK